MKKIILWLLLKVNAFQVLPVFVFKFLYERSSTECGGISYKKNDRACERTKTEETRTQRETSKFYDKTFIEPNPKLFFLKQ